MNTSDLFDVFGGRDNLRLMCEARGLYASEERMFIRFEVGDKVVFLFPFPPYCEMKYGFLVHLSGSTFAEVVNTRVADEIAVRDLFKRYTGYSLSF